jgi:hypothetical protein
MGMIPLVVISRRSRNFVMKAYEYFAEAIRSNMDGNSIETPDDLKGGASDKSFHD